MAEELVASFFEFLGFGVSSDANYGGGARWSVIILVSVLVLFGMWLIWFLTR